jgi:hypothetical protein
MKSKAAKLRRSVKGVEEGQKIRCTLAALKSKA